ncbi:putative ribonuclease H-like domain-containing protein [Tanacetum coccineum]
MPPHVATTATTINIIPSPSSPPSATAIPTLKPRTIATTTGPPPRISKSIEGGFGHFGGQFLKEILDESQVLIKVPRRTTLCDNGTEFKNNDMNQFCGMKGIKREFSVARTPQQNGVAERKNKTLIEAARTMLADSFLPTYIWGTIVYAFIEDLFGCTLTILNTLDPLGKFDRKADEGFCPQSSEDAVADDASKKTNEEPANEGERNSKEKDGGASNKEDDQNVQDFRAELDNFLVQQKEVYANSTNRDCTISPSDTTDLLNTGIFSGAYDDEDVGAEADLNTLEITMNVSLIPTTRIHKDHPKDQIIRDINSSTQTRRMAKISEEHALVSYINKQRRTKHKDYQNCLFAYFLSQKEPKKVIQALDDPSWIEVMQEELLQFKLQKVWTLVDNQMEEVYVCQPPGFEDPQFPDKVYKVKKALYGLHQAPKAWYETLPTDLLENGFRRGTIDKTLFIKKDKVISVCPRVWLMTSLFGSTKKSLCVKFEQMMHKRFQMSSIGGLTFFLGLQVKQKDDGIFISQDKYVAGILKKFDFATVKTTSTPIDTNKALLKDEEAEDVRCSTFDCGSLSDMDYTGASLNRKFQPTGGFNFFGKRIDSISNEFGVKTGGCKVNAARQDLVLLGKS